MNNFRFKLFKKKKNQVSNNEEKFIKYVIKHNDEIESTQKDKHAASQYLFFDSLIGNDYNDRVSKTENYEYSYRSVNIVQSFDASNSIQKSDTINSNNRNSEQYPLHQLEEIKGKKKIFKLNIKGYSKFCNRFKKYSLIPKLRFFNLEDRYKENFKKRYNIEEDDLNKATFIICILTFFISFLPLLFFFSYLFKKFNQLVLFYAIIGSLIMSICISYYFNKVILKIIIKEEKAINAIFDFIGLDFSLIQYSEKDNSDLCIKFIELMNNYEVPLSNSFNAILSKVHQGSTPEKELEKVITPSKDFNTYLENQLIEDFRINFNLDKVERQQSEDRFNEYLKSLKSKISLIFGFGFLTPLLFCIFIMFSTISGLGIILLSLLFLFFMFIVYHYFIKFDDFIIGLMHNSSRLDKKKFDEFLIFIRAFSKQLSHNRSPEISFQIAYSKNKKHFHELKEIFSTCVSNLANANQSFEFIINLLKIELNSYRYSLILNAICRMIKENSLITSGRLKEILDIIHNQRQLESKLEIKLKSESFRASLFLYANPFIIGVLGGLAPIFSFLLRFSNSYSFDANYQIINYIISANNTNLIPLGFSLISWILISSYFILKVIKKHKISYRYLLVILLFFTVYLTVNFVLITSLSSIFF